MSVDEGFAKYKKFEEETPDSHTIVWHVSPTGNRQSIESLGLKTSDPNGGGFWTRADNATHPKGVYVSADGPMTTDHPSNENRVFYGGDIYAVRVPKLNLRSHTLNGKQFGEYVRTAVTKKNVLRVGHQAPLFPGFGDDKDTDRFHWGDEDTCDNCQDKWGSAKKEAESRQAEFEKRWTPDVDENGNKVWSQSRPASEVDQILHKTAYGNQPDFKPLTEIKTTVNSSPMDSFNADVAEWKKTRGDGAYASMKYARMV